MSSEKRVDYMRLPLPISISTREHNFFRRKKSETAYLFFSNSIANEFLLLGVFLFKFKYLVTDAKTAEHSGVLTL